jgi:hypothetical protein
MESSVPWASPYWDDTLTKLVGKWFRQIIPLGIRHTFRPDTNFIPLLQVPRLSHCSTLGASDPRPQVAPQLGVSFNAQSQTPAIPGISTRNALSL